MTGELPASRQVLRLHTATKWPRPNLQQAKVSQPSARNASSHSHVNNLRFGLAVALQTPEVGHEACFATTTAARGDVFVGFR